MSNLSHHISIGIITYNNSKDEINKCLNAIYAQNYPQNKIEIIIRNQGDPNCISYVNEYVAQNQTTNLRIIVGENVGFGRGHNLIVKEIDSRSKAYLCLNPDGFLHKDGLLNLVKHAELKSWCGLFEAIQEPIMHPKKFSPKTGLTEWCSAACLLIPITVFNKINGFDEDFFIYCEDVDLSWQAKGYGYNCYTVANAMLFHFTEDRYDESKRLIASWRSAYILAYKWRASNFLSFAKNNLLKLIDISEEDLENEVKNITRHPLQFIFKAKPNFNTGLVFSERMWEPR